MRTIKTLVVIFFLAVCSYFIAGCNGNAESKTTNGGEETAIPVEVSQVGRGDISAVFSGTANLEAEGEATVVAKVSGVIKRILVEEGDYVSKGQVLAKLDDEQPLYRRNQALANLNKSKSELERSEELYKKNLISEEEFDRIKFDYASLKAAYDLAQLEVTYTSIKAPISGIVATRFIKEGNMLNINDPTFKITDFTPLNAIIYVPERHMSKLQKNQPVKLSVDALAQNGFSGHIARISPIVDPNSGTVKVTVEVDDPRGKLKPGMFGRVSIIYDVHSNTLMVPKEAVMTEDRESAVYVIRDTVALRQTVEVGYTNATHIEIKEGLVEGDTVVTIGQSSLKDSSKIMIINDAYAKKDEQ